MTEKKTRPKYKGGARTAILNVIRANRKGLIASDIVKITDLSISSVYKILPGLMAEGLVKRIPEGTGYRYFHRKVHDNEMIPTLTRVKMVPSAEERKYTVNVEPVDLYNFLTKWQKTWEPKIFESARNLPLGLARIFELACEQAFGSLVSEDDLLDVKISMAQFKNDLEQTLRVVNGILDDNRIWDRHRFTLMTLADHDIDKIRAIAFKVKQAN